MDKILGGLVLMNGTDIWTEYGVFLAEEKRGGMDNLTAIRRSISGRNTGRSTPPR